MNPIGWIELAATDLDRAEKFYSDYFGFTFNRQSEFDSHIMSWFEPMDMKVYGSGITLLLGPNAIPSTEGPLVYFDAPTETITEALVKAKEQGIEILQDATSGGEHGFYCIAKDSEGNRFAIHSMKE